MIRLIVQVQDYGTAAHVEGAKAAIAYKTFDIEHTELENLIRNPGSYSYAQVVGAALAPPPAEVREAGVK